MPGIRIVSDSSVHLPGRNVREKDILTVVPNRLKIGSDVIREGIDLDAQAALDLIARQDQAPQIIPPTVEEFAEIYTRLARDSHAIISIHPSREIFANWQNAKIAAQQVMGQTEIVVIDSQSLCGGHAILVQLALRLLDEGTPADEIVRRVRGAVDRLYTVYYVTRTRFLMQNRIMSGSHAILGTMLGIKPFLAIENGHIMPMEKVKTHAQAIDRLVEFASEFDCVDDIVLHYHSPKNEDYLRALRERLVQFFPGQSFGQMLYSPSLAALIGADGMGITVLESEMDDYTDDDED